MYKCHIAIYSLNEIYYDLLKVTYKVYCICGLLPVRSVSATVFKIAGKQLVSTIRCPIVCIFNRLLLSLFSLVTIKS